MRNYNTRERAMQNQDTWLRPVCGNLEDAFQNQGFPEGVVSVQIAVLVTHGSKYMNVCTFVFQYFSHNERLE